MQMHNSQLGYIVSMKNPASHLGAAWSTRKIKILHVETASAISARCKVHMAGMLGMEGLGPPGSESSSRIPSKAHRLQPTAGEQPRESALGSPVFACFLD